MKLATLLTLVILSFIITSCVFSDDKDDEGSNQNNNINDGLSGDSHDRYTSDYQGTPDAPTNLRANFYDAGGLEVVLEWDEVFTQGVYFYEIYRSDLDQREFENIGHINFAMQDDQERKFVDRNFHYQGLYYYYIEAGNGAGKTQGQTVEVYVQGASLQQFTDYSNTNVDSVADDSEGAQEGNQNGLTVESCDRVFEGECAFYMCSMGYPDYCGFVNVVDNGIDSTIGEETLFEGSVQLLMGQNGVATFDWSVSEGVTYNLYKASGIGAAEQILATGVLPPFDDTEIAANTAYIYILAEVDAAGVESNKGESVLIQSGPSKPLDIVVSNQTAATAELNWSASAGAIGYTIFKIVPNGDDELIDQSVESTYFVSQLPSGVTTQFLIYANGMANSIGMPASDTVTITTVYAAPTGLTVSQGELNKISLAWNALEGLTGVSYTVYRALDANGDFEMIADSVLQLQYVDESVQPLTNYYYMIQVVDSMGIGSLLSNGSVGSALEVLPPTGVEWDRDDVLNGYVKLTWNSAEGATAYRLYRRTATLSGSWGLINAFAEVNDTVYLDSSVYERLEYAYGVTAVNSEGVESSVVTVNGDAYMMEGSGPDHQHYIHVTADMSVTGQITLNWNVTASGHDTFYEVYRKVEGVDAFYTYIDRVNAPTVAVLVNDLQSGDVVDYWIEPHFQISGVHYAFAGMQIGASYANNLEGLVVP